MCSQRASTQGVWVATKFDSDLLPQAEGPRLDTRKSILIQQRTVRTMLNSHLITKYRRQAQFGALEKTWEKHRFKLLEDW
jgi:hypothetical protein